MKRLIIVLFAAFSLSITTTNAQFYTDSFLQEYVTDFGDPTGYYFCVSESTGIFFNQAGVQHRAFLSVILIQNTAFCVLAEYNPESYTKRTDLYTTFVGKTDLTKHTFYIGWPELPLHTICEMFNNNDTVDVTIRSTDPSSNYKAIFRLTGCKRFAKLYKENYNTLIQSL